MADELEVKDEHKEGQEDAGEEEVDNLYSPNGLSAGTRGSISTSLFSADFG